MRFILFSLFILSVQAKEYTANDTSQIRIIANKLKAGDTVKLTAQVYKAGLTLSNLQGTSSKPIIIDGQNKAVFQKGKSGIHLVDCHHVILKNLTVKDISINGINIDDGGTEETPPEGIILDNVTVLNVGPKGNFDCVKLSGLNKFIIKNCTISGWGGSAIDMVGCHNGLIENNRLIGKSGFSQSSGIQIKGGSFGTKVFNNFFDNAGSRAINLGGSTGLEWFRPKGANFEAKDIEVAGNIFKGSESFIAFVTCTNGYVHHNTFVEPGKWVLRILQETKDPHFIKAQKGRFENNLVVYDQKVRTFVNVGSGTKPETFVFKSNAWFDKRGGKKAPKLPTNETQGIYGVDPKLDKAFKSTNTKLNKYGAGAFKK